MSGNPLVTIIIPTFNEAANIQTLLSSIHNQCYRPIEVIVVDGGSSDKTVEIAKAHAQIMNSSDYQTFVFLEKEYCSRCSSANARNIGIDHSRGPYLMFFDADFSLSDKYLVNYLVSELARYPWVGVKVKPIVDSWIEKNLAVNDALGQRVNVHKYCAVRKDSLNGKRFNSEMGFGEDELFFKGLNLNVKIIDAFVDRHFPETLDDYKKQKLWYSRTVWAYLNVSFSWGKFLELVIMPTVPIGLILIAFLLLPFNWLGSAIIALVYLVLLLRAFITGPERNFSRLSFELFDRSLGSLLYCCGLIKGLFKTYLTRD